MFQKLHSLILQTLPFKNLIVAGLLLLAVPITNATAVEVTADSVSENFIPPRILNFACADSVSVLSNGSIANFDGYCPRNTTPSNYEITFNFSPAPAEGMSAIKIWANAGNIYSDGELRTFDLEVDYIDSGVASTLAMSVNLGDTLSPNDPKTVTLVSGGAPVTLFGVSAVRLSNIAGPGPDLAARELVGVFDDRGIDLVISKSVNDDKPNIGDVITFTLTVENNGPNAANNYTVVDNVPAGFGGIANISNGGTVNASNQITWTLGSLASGTSLDLTFDVTVLAP